MTISRQATTETTAKLTIGSLKLESPVMLAPMAGFTDSVLRGLVRMYSIKCLVVSEMVSAEGMHWGHEKELLNFNEVEKPLAFQLSGHKPELMAEGARKLEAISSLIDINMGCPVPKIVKNHDGSKLMTDLSLASSIIKAVKEAVNIPVTVKCRLGWDCGSKNHVEFAKMVEDSGADAIIVHGRTRSQMYSGKADWAAIGEVKQAVNIPVVGNGDITTPQMAKKCLEISGCDGVAIGRGVLGDPGLIGRIENYLLNGESETEPNDKDRHTGLSLQEIALLHCRKEVEYRGEEQGIRYMRKFFAHYVRGVRNACAYRFDLVRCSTLAEVEAVFAEIATSNSLP